MVAVRLKTNGYEIELDNITYSGSLDNLARTNFIRFEGKEKNDLRELKSLFKEGLTAEVYFDDALVFAGLMIDVLPSFKNKKPILELRVNSPISKYCGTQKGFGKHYVNQKVSEIIKDLCPDIVLKVGKDIQLKRFITYSTEDVDTTLARLSQVSDILIYSDISGALVLGQYNHNQKPVALIEDNILDISPIEIDDDDITIIGQNSLDDNLSLADVIKPRLHSLGSKKRCVYVDDVSIQSLNKMTNDKKKFELKITDWFDTDNNILDLNKVVAVKNSWVGVDDNFLIRSIIFKKDPVSGYSATLLVETKNA